MSQSVGFSARSLMTAGVSAAMVGAVALTPVIVSEPANVALPPIHMVAPEIQLASAGSDIKAIYDAAEPWAAYAASLADYALSFVPGLWWIAPAIDLAYFSIEPLVQAGVYSFADLIDLNAAQIPIDIQAGIQEATTNFVNYGLAWIGSLVPLPPLPPLPPFPGAAMRAPAAARALGPRAAAAAVAAAAAPVAAAPVAAETEAVTATAPVTVAAPRSRRDAGRAPRVAATNATAADSKAPAAAAATDASPAPAKASHTPRRGA